MDATPTADTGGRMASANAGPAIAVEGLVKHYGKLAAIDGIDFSVARGSVTALLGGNGAGKTTTIAILLGLIRPTQGASISWARISPPIPKPSLHG